VYVLMLKGRTRWVRESDEPDVELYGGGRKGVKRYVSFGFRLFGLLPVLLTAEIIISINN